LEEAIIVGIFGGAGGLVYFTHLPELVPEPSAK
jgi:hypothetical protein